MNKFMNERSLNTFMHNTVHKVVNLSWWKFATDLLNVHFVPKWLSDRLKACV